MKFFTISILVLTAISIGSANGYELGTHARFTNAAFEQSILHDTSFMHDLGLDPNDPQPFGEIYFDVSGATINERNRNAFEVGYMPDGAKPLSINGWLMRGAIREDDAKGEDNPQDDPFNPDLRRPLHHFFDPVNNRPLSVPGLSLIDSDVHTAPNWAVGGRDVFTQPNVAEANRRNHFTVFDAREAMYRALTGRDSQGNVIAATEAERNKYWATTFRALGDVVHLVQDMGQPQHTRNDPHSGKGPAVVQALLSGHKSIFEEYIDARATGATSYSIDGLPPKQWPPLIYTGHPPPAFTKYSDFWSTRNGVSGRGLADYSNRGFFSAGTNLGGNGYASPSNNAASYTPESASGLLPNQPQKINFLRGNVYDYNLNPGTANIRMTTESLFDNFLLTNKTYSLNRFNYDDMADLLIPRAVGYSAGLINYFFRGKIDFVPDPTSAGKYTIKNLGAEGMTGTFTLYYDAVDGNRYPVAGDAPTETWTNRTIDVKQQLDSLSFTPPTNPAPKTDGEYVLVFQGSMGEEKAENGVVGAVIAKRIQSGGATDYVSMAMPNPVPYRGLFTGGTDYDPSSGTYSDAVIATSDEVVIFQAPAIAGGGGGYGETGTIYPFINYLYDHYTSFETWNGGGTFWLITLYIYDFDGGGGVGNFRFTDKVTFNIPEDCIYPVPDNRAPNYNLDDSEPAIVLQWKSNWADGVTAFNLRRKAWFKKNSDEFVAALKTGFSPSTAGVSRAELKTGALPPAWEFQIKRDVDVKYDGYAPTNTIGRKTKRTIQYAEKTGTFAETVESDTSADLTQAGVKVTKRVVTLTYQYPGEDGPREFPITGYLTQTVTQHITRYDDTSGDYLLSQKDVYDTWYIREDTILPDGVPSTIAAAYLNDRTGGRIGVVLNGAVQNGYNADSTLGEVYNPLPYADYTPAYPAASSTVVAVTPDYIKTWHKDAKIEYLENGVGASTVQNDSALYGVTQIEITPVGLIADGNGTAPAGASLGIFSSGETGTQVEIYGTAVYNFDWQTGAFTFNKWKPLHDAGGNEVASKVVNLPVGTVFPINNSTITYKGLHWPDVITAIAVRDQSLPTAASPSDKILYELIKAIKAE